MTAPVIATMFGKLWSRAVGRSRGRVFFANLGNKGRLGNQLFQIASTIGIARANGMHAVFPAWSYERYFQRSLARAGADDGALPVRREPAFNYTPVILQESCIIDGFFQSESYFRRWARQIRAQFELRDMYRSEVERRFAAYRAPDCALHVRRGDYVDNPRYYDLGAGCYYEEALRQLDSRTRVLCFSDDPQWCRQRLRDSRIDFVDPGDDILDLFLYARCRISIIANSSFSWWGAWLNRNRGAAVFAPDRWFIGEIADPTLPPRFGPNGYRGFHDASDIIPSGWRTLRS